MPVHDKVIEIIVYILNEIKKGRDITEADIEKLSAKGYSGSDINTALEWFYEKLNSSEVMYEDSESRSASHRFFNKAENLLFTKEAKGFLLQMSRIENVPRAELEILIDKLVLSGRPGINEDDIKMLANMLEGGKNEFAVTLNSFMQGGNETIN